MISAENQAQVLSMHFIDKLSVRAIARKLKLNRKSVVRIIGTRKILESRTASKRRSILDPFRENIAEMLQKDPKLPNVVVMQNLRKLGYLGGKSVLGDLLLKIRPVEPGKREAFLKLYFEPGECAQVDWGEFGDVFGDGGKIHCFVMVLCYSRMLYLEFTRSEKFEDFIRCHERAIRYFSDLLPKECWYDNLASAVTERHSTLVKFNARFYSYAVHHNFRPHACNQGKGNEKGRVEDGVKYIRSAFWPGRTFADYKNLCSQAREWIDNFANRREHRATHKVPLHVYEHIEKAAMQKRNPHQYDTEEVITKIVPPNFHITFESNLYSVPWTLVGIPVTIKVDDEQVKIYYNEKFITAHERIYQRYKESSKPEHKKGLLERKPGNSRESWQIGAIKSIGPNMGEYLKTVTQHARSLHRELSKLLALATVYGENQVDATCLELMKSGVVGADNVELVLKRNSSNVTQPEPLTFQNPTLNRPIHSVDLRQYDSMILDSRKEEKDDE